MKDSTTINDFRTEEVLKPEAKERIQYSSYLDKFGYTYSESEYHYHVGELTLVQGWLIHLTSIPSQMEKLLETILPVIKSMTLSFKIIKEKQKLVSLNNGEYGINQLGKTVTLYPTTDEICTALAKQLITITSEFKGPSIVTDFLLGGIVYTRYGGFKPIIGTDLNGTKEKFIYKVNGELKQDHYYIPARQPDGINNPFRMLVPNMGVPKKVKTLGNRVLPLKLLKGDFRGNVFSGLYFINFSLKSVVIKEGLPYHLSDENGRDIRSRYYWQYEVQKSIGSRINTPKIYEIFEEEERIYIIMEQIKGGKDLSDICYTLLDNQPWYKVKIKNKKLILRHLIEVLEMIEQIHMANYVHHDITPTNILVKNKSIYLIDLELAYSTKENKPNPAYGVGTPGFMAKNQKDRKRPKISDDIYAIGALLISCTTGMDPIRLFRDNIENLREKLLFLLQNEELVNVIVSCQDSNSDVRPSLIKIKTVLEEYIATIESNTLHIREYDISDAKIKNAYEGGLRALNSAALTHNNLWVSQNMDAFDLDINPLGFKSIYPGMHTGVCGVLYLVNILRQLKVEVNLDREIEAASWKHLENHFLTNEQDNPPGLSLGSAGLAMLLAASMRSGYLQPVEANKKLLVTCLNRESNFTDILYGTAGQGIAALNCEDFISEESFNGLMDQFTNKLLDQQLKDGSWSQFNRERKANEKTNGFGYGVAGIVYYLLEIGKKRSNEGILESAFKGLSYLNRACRKKGDHYVWINSNINNHTSQWWCHGSPGMSLTYLKAFEITGNKAYKETAEKSLRINPQHFIYHNLSICHGMAGLGEIYLEAYRILKEKEWLEKAAWVARLLTSLKLEENGYYLWLTENSEFSTADLLSGQAGIIHFLFRFTHPELLQFPLLSTPKLSI